MKIAIIGAGKGGQLIAAYISDSGAYDTYFGCLFEMFDDKIEGIRKLSEIPEDYKIIISSSNMPFRRRVFAEFERKRYININRSSYFPSMGVGNIIFPNVEFDYFAEIGDNNVISTSTIINHHCRVGSHNLLGPGCLMSGSVTIGDNCLIGSSVIFEPGVSVGNWCVIASGSVIVGNIPDNSNIMAGKDFKNHGIYQGDRTIRTRI